MEKSKGAPQITPHDPEHVGSRRDPEERSLSRASERREKSFDKTLADSFPTSDPPSSIPDPGEDRSSSGATSPQTPNDTLLAGLKAGSWAAISIDGKKVVGTGATQEEAEQDAKNRNFSQVELVKVPETKKAS